MYGSHLTGDYLAEAKSAYERRDFDNLCLQGFYDEVHIAMVENGIIEPSEEAIDKELRKFLHL